MMFSPELEARFEKFLAKYPADRKRSAMIPMLIYAVALWGLGLGLGYALAFAPWPSLWSTPRGAVGFWIAQTLSLVVAAIALHWELARISRPALWR